MRIPAYDIRNTFEERISNVQDASLNVTDWRLILRRAIRRRVLMGYSGLQLADLVIDYGVMLDEDSDAIEVILDYELKYRK